MSSGPQPGPRPKLRQLCQYDLALQRVGHARLPRHSGCTLHEAVEAGDLTAVHNLLQHGHSAGAMTAGLPSQGAAPAPLARKYLRTGCDAAAQAVRTAVNTRSGWGWTALMLAAANGEPPPEKDEFELLEEAEQGIKPELPDGWVHVYEDEDAKESGGGSSYSDSGGSSYSGSGSGSDEDDDDIVAEDADDDLYGDGEQEDREPVRPVGYLHAPTGLRRGLDAKPRHSHLEIARLLLDAGASPSAVDHDGMTALHHACRKGDQAMAQLLLDAGSDVLQKSYGGQTPTSLAEMYDHEETLHALFPQVRAAKHEIAERQRLEQRRVEAERHEHERQLMLRANATQATALVELGQEQEHGQEQEQQPPQQQLLLPKA